MKIGEKELKKMILLELAARVAGGDNPVGITNDFETHAFTTHVNAIRENLVQMRKVVEENEGLTRSQLVEFRERAIGDLYATVQSVEDAIDLRLKTQR
tara:strand:- start:445 stop:738 length:294 start_codon:yes stop_codon:yes gene_type:complete